ncbi:unnamed protein product, partial [Brassica oleracea]
VLFFFFLIPKLFRSIVFSELLCICFLLGFDFVILDFFCFFCPSWIVIG